MGFLLEAMHSAVGSLLEQSVEWGRIEAAHQERKTAMRTNKVCGQAASPLVTSRDCFCFRASSMHPREARICSREDDRSRGGLLPEKKAGLASRKAMKAASTAKPAV